MSSIALASQPQGFGSDGSSANRRHARRRTAGAARTPRPLFLSEGDGGAVGLPRGRAPTPLYVWWLLGIAVALHVAAAWYVHSLPTRDSTQPARREVTIDLERPKPPPPKLQPPKPEPPRPQQQRPAQVLPQIETPAPLPTDADAVSSIPPVPAPPPAAPPAPVAELPVTAAFGRAGYLNNPPPSYPALAMRQGWQGTVVLRVRVLANGHAANVEVQKSSGRKVLDDAAIQTVQGWAFAPAKRGETPIDGWATVPIEFKVE